MSTHKNGKRWSWKLEKKGYFLTRSSVHTPKERTNSGFGQIENRTTSIYNCHFQASKKTTQSSGPSRYYGKVRSEAQDFTSPTENMCMWLPPRKEDPFLESHESDSYLVPFKIFFHGVERNIHGAFWYHYFFTLFCSFFFFPFFVFFWTETIKYVWFCCFQQLFSKICFKIYVLLEKKNVSFVSIPKRTYLKEK